MTGDNSGNPVELRPAKAADYLGAAEVIIRSRNASVPAIPPSMHTPDDMRQHFSTRVMPEARSWVADNEGQIVAVLITTPGWIDHLYVDPDWTGSGLGSQFLEIAKADQDELTLWTFQSNLGARRFYERHGFSAVESTDGDNEEAAPDVRYAWPP